jgi:predicted ribosomally synthesized peptide with SipW-like signal peptide
MTRTTPTTGRHRAPRRLRWVWALGVALVTAVAAAVVSSGSTYALWNSSAETEGVTVRSGTATLAVTAIAVGAPAPLAPGTSTTGTFTVRNSGTVPLSVRLALTGTKVAYVPSVPAAAVLDELTVRLSSVARASDCRPGLSGYSARPAAFDTGSGYSTLPVGDTGTACVEVVLDADAPQTVAGAVTDFTLTVTGTQVAG